MDLGSAGLNAQPFKTHGKPLTTYVHSSHKEGMQVLRDACAKPFGLALIQGPALSGKSTLIREFVESCPEECAIAVVDGNGLNTQGLLQAILRQFGYALDLHSTNELLGLLRVFTLQQARSHEPPILIIKNTHALKASALRALCELAALRVRRSSALKIILVSDRALLPLVESPEMEVLAQRLTHDFHVRPMTNEEVMEYLYSKLRAAGSIVPEFVFPVSVCTELWRASGGWPGILDRVALLSLANSDTLPVPPESIEPAVLPQGTWLECNQVAVAAATPLAAEPPAAPTLIVSHEGQTLQERVFEQPRILIGRSEYNDIAITSRFISRHHALLVRHGSATFLMDLNSTNGTFVNSRRVSNHVLIHDDVITVGNHRIKFNDSDTTHRSSLDGIEFANTSIMRSLEDMRQLLDHENTELLPSATENLPTTRI